MAGRKVAPYVTGMLQTTDLGKMMSGGLTSETEDCLFLDVVVPGEALRGRVKLPVANWYV
jgi:carboxylesterase type B